MEGHQLNPRIALAAQGSPEDLRIQNVVILIVAIVSALGASWMILSFLLFPSVRTFRHQLILGLAISDLIMSLNFITSTATNLSGSFIGSPSMRPFCLYNGFITQWFVVQTDYWVLTIALCTYITITTRNRPATFIRQNKWLPFTIPPLLSLVWACIGLGLRAYDNIGAWCWFPSDKTRLLVNFIPRWCIVLVCAGVYGHLFWRIWRTEGRWRRVVSQSGEGFGREEEGWRDGVVEEENGAVKTKLDEKSSSSASSSSSPTTTTSTPQTYRLPPSLRKIAYQMMTYPLVYILIWTIPTTIRIYQSSTGKAAPTTIATLDKACIVIQGFFDACVYGYNEGSVGAWGKLLRGLRDRWWKGRSGIL